MGVFYVDGIEGSDANNGLSRATAKATIAGVRAVLTSNARDLVYVRPGIYIQTKIVFNSVVDNLTIYKTDTYYSGVAVFDFNKSSDIIAGQDCYFQINATTTFVNVHFRGMAGTYRALRQSLGGGFSAWHCIFYNIGTTTGWGYQDDIAATGTVRNCSFYNLAAGVVGWTSTSIRGCYFNSCALNFNPEITNRDYNAFPGNTETNGINTTGADPGFVSPNTGDLRLNAANLTYWQALMSGGENGGRIGAVCYGSLIYGNEFDSFYPMSPNPSTAAGNLNLEWENEGPSGSNTYTTGTPGDIIYSGGGLKIDLAATPGATGGRVRSEVYDLGASGNPLLYNAILTYFEDPSSGAVLDTDTYYPRKFEYRSSNTSFTKNDGTPTWTDVSETDYINASHRYVQFRITFQTGHTNS